MICDKCKTNIDPYRDSGLPMPELEKSPNIVWQMIVCIFSFIHGLGRGFLNWFDDFDVLLPITFFIIILGSILIAGVCLIYTPSEGSHCYVNDGVLRINVDFGEDRRIKTISSIEDANMAAQAYGCTIK